MGESPLAAERQDVRPTTRMNVLAERGGVIFAVVTIQEAADFAPPFRGVAFPCLIWDHQGILADAERAAVAAALLDADCRYAVCGGEECEAWHDAVDQEFVARHLDDRDEVGDSAHVMTSWHEGETPDDVAFFFVRNTNFDQHDFKRFLVLHVGTSPATGQVDSAVRKYALGGEAA